MIKISDATEIPAAEGATIHLTQDRAFGVGCVVKIDGGLLPPAVILTVDGEERTDLFTPLIKSQKLQGLDNGLEKYYTEVKYTYLTVAPSSELNQKNLTCVASAGDFPSRIASVYLDVKCTWILSLMTCWSYIFT